MDTERTAHTNRVEMSGNHSLKLMLKAPDFTRSYGVLQTFEKEGMSDTVKYNVDVTFVRTIINRSRIFRVDRSSEVYINDSPPDLLADQLAHECGKIFYPLLAEVGFDGRFLAVYNQADILERWKMRRPELEEYFKGELTKRYMDLMERVLVDPEAVSDVFRNDLFCQVYFASLFKSYSAAQALEEQLQFALCGRAPGLIFTVARAVMPELTAVGKIEVLHTGKSSDERSITDIEEEQRFALEVMTNPSVEVVKASYNARYILDPETKAIHSAVADWTLEMKSPERTELKLFELEKPVEIDPETAEERSPGMVFIDGKKEKTDKKITDIFNFLWK